MLIRDKKYLLIKKTAALLLLLLLCIQNGKCTGKPDRKKNPQIDSLEHLLHKSLPDSIKIEALYTLSSLLYESSTNQALVYTTEALKLARENTHHRHLTLLCQMGNIYSRIPDYPKALKYYFEGLKEAEIKNDVKEQVGLLNNIGHCYCSLNQFGLAGKYLRLAEKTAVENGITSYLRPIYSNLGSLASDEGDLTGSIVYYKKALEINKTQDKHVGALYNNLGNIYATLNKASLAEEYFRKALHTVDTSDIYILTAVFTSLGDLLTLQKRFPEAKHYYFAALEKNQVTGTNKETIALCESIAVMYEKQKDFSNAYKYSKLAKTLQDSVYKETFIAQMNEMQATYESQKKDQKIESLNKDRQLIRERVHREQLLRNAVITALALLSVILFILVRNIFHKQKTNRILLAKNELIEHQKKEIAHKKEEIEDKNKKLNQFNRELIEDNIYARYEVLKSKVNPHFLFNSLGSLGTLILSNPERAFEFVSRFSQLYRTIIATSDQQLITLQKEIQLVKDYVYLQQIRFDKNLMVEFENDDINKALYVPPFALQIVVENVLKHNVISSKNPLNVRICIDDKKITVTNTLQPRKNVAESTGSGQKNLIERYRLITKTQPVFKQQDNIYIASIPLITKTEKNQPQETVT